MISPRFLVITRGPAETMHFDIVLAANEALAADRVRQTRRGATRPARRARTRAASGGTRTSWPAWPCG